MKLKNLYHSVYISNSTQYLLNGIQEIPLGSHIVIKCSHLEDAKCYPAAGRIFLLYGGFVQGLTAQKIQLCICNRTTQFWSSV